MKLHKSFWLVALSVLASPSIGYADAADPTDPASTAPIERLRQIPKDAYKGVMWPPQGRHVRINDSIMRLAPGATIRDMNNRMVLPQSVRQPKKIRYTLDMYGQVRKIWISPTGEYIGRRQPVDPPKGRNDDGADDSADDATDETGDDSTDDATDDSEDDATDTPDA